MRWLFIGAGNMASSLIGGLLGGGTDSSHIAVVDPDKSACQRAQKAFDIGSAQNIQDAIALLVANADDHPPLLGVVIAVKPHIVESVCRAFEQSFNEAGLAGEGKGDGKGVSPVFISVAAGTRKLWP